MTTPITPIPNYFPCTACRTPTLYLPSYEIKNLCPDCKILLNNEYNPFSIITYDEYLCHIDNLLKE